MKDQNCGNCRFFNPGEMQDVNGERYSDGECRRFPPTLCAASAESNARSLYVLEQGEIASEMPLIDVSWYEEALKDTGCWAHPRLWDSQWCGEWQGKN